MSSEDGRANTRLQISRLATNGRAIVVLNKYKLERRGAGLIKAWESNSNYAERLYI